MKKILPLLLLLSANICYGNTGAQIFADDFETIGLFAENWKAPAGIKPANGVLKIPGGTVTLRRDLKDQDFIFSADITPLPRT